MKVKILIPPLIIVSCIALMVWLVYPAYTNGTDGIKEKRAKMLKGKEELADAQKKAENVSRMMAQLENSKADRDTIMTFIPDEPREEEIIDNLNFIASNEGLSVTELSVKPAAAAVVQAEASEEAAMMAAGDDSMDPIVPVENVVVKAKNYDVEFSVVGNYEKIKNVLDKVYKLERFNDVQSLDIAENKSTGGEGEKQKSEAPQDNLKADMVLSFNMVKKYTGTVSMTNPVFSQASFDMKVATDIRNKKSVDVLKMNIDQAGRANPFIP